MAPVYHILNGDALMDQFPTDLEGEKIVMREALVDGEVSGETLEAFYATRDRFMSQHYPECEPGDYHKVTVPEIQKIQNIPIGSEVNLWFEDDLFCQVNFWFVVWLLHSNGHRNLFLVRPDAHTHYGFSRFDREGLKSLMDQRILLTQLETIASLWGHYQNRELDMLTEKAALLKQFPFILEAVQAHRDRFAENGPGRPERSLARIMEELGTTDFGPVFGAFCKEESIYGFGDLQVKRIYDKLIQER